MIKHIRTLLPLYTETKKMQTKLTEVQIAALARPLPKEAIKQHPTKKYLSTINAIYVVERLNEAFGHGGWTITHEIIEHSEKMVVLRGVMTVADCPWFRVEQFGGNDNVDKGDAFKGAATDCLTKIGSYLGIGADVWKDKDKANGNGHSNGSAPAPTAKPMARLKDIQGAKTLEELRLAWLGCTKEEQAALLTDKELRKAELTN